MASLLRCCCSRNVLDHLLILDDCGAGCRAGNMVCSLCRDWFCTYQQPLLLYLLSILQSWTLLLSCSLRLQTRR